MSRASTQKHKSPTKQAIRSGAVSGELSTFGFGSPVLADGFRVLFEAPVIGTGRSPSFGDAKILSSGKNREAVALSWPSVESFDAFADSLYQAVLAYFRKGQPGLDEERFREAFLQRFDKEISPAGKIVVCVGLGRSSWFVFESAHSITNGILFYAVALAFPLAFKMEAGEIAPGFYLRRAISCRGVDGVVECSDYAPGLFGIAPDLSLDDLRFDFAAKITLYADNTVAICPTVGQP